jgi:hypothetical protein
MGIRSRRVVRVAGWRKGRRQNRLVKLQRQVRALKPELKCFQLPFTFSNQAAGAAIFYASAIAQGSDVFNRLGDKISQKKVYWQCGMNQAVGTSVTDWRLFLIRDLESNGVVPTVSGAVQAIFTSSDPDNAVIQNNTKERFKIMSVFDWHDPTVALGGERSGIRHAWVRTGTESRYHDATANQTGAGKNAYYVVVMTNTASVTTDLDGVLEFYYTDA